MFNDISRRCLPATDGTHYLSLQTSDWAVALLMAGKIGTLHLSDLGTCVLGQLRLVTCLRYLHVCDTDGLDPCVEATFE